MTVARINWQCDVYGRGGIAAASRRLVFALVALGHDVSVENLRPSCSAGVYVTGAEAVTIDALLRKRVDPRAYCHVRYGPRQPGERGLVDGLIRPVPRARNVWFRSIDSTLMGGTSGETVATTVDEVWASSSFASTAVAATGVPVEAIHVVPHGVDASQFCPDGPRAALKLGPGVNFVFLTVADARFAGRKGIDVLVRTFVETFTGADGVALLIHTRADDAAVAALRAQVDATLASARTPPAPIHIDARDAPDVAPLYRAANCYVQPSRGESFGLSILEAMACALPVVTTAFGGHLDFVGPDAGWFVDYDVVAASPPVADRGVWAEPRPSSLRAALLAAAASEPSARSAIGARNRAVAETMTWERAGAAAAERAVALLS